MMHTSIASTASREIHEKWETIPGSTFISAVMAPVLINCKFFSILLDAFRANHFWKKKKNQVSHESKCSLTYQHTQANRRENQWAQYSLDLYRETKCPTDFLFVIWSTHRILTELFGGDAASPAEEGLTPACHTATESSRAAGALSELSQTRTGTIKSRALSWKSRKTKLIISFSFLKQDGKCKERKKNDLSHNHTTV